MIKFIGGFLPETGLSVGHIVSAITILVVVVALPLAGFAVGQRWGVEPGEDGREQYYRALYDYCMYQFGDPGLCNAEVSELAAGYDARLYGQESPGYIYDPSRKGTP